MGDTNLAGLGSSHTKGVQWRPRRAMWQVPATKVKKNAPSEYAWKERLQLDIMIMRAIYKGNLCGCMSFLFLPLSFLSS